MLNANWNQPSTWSYPTQILYGAGRIKEVGLFCQDHHWKRPLLVVDPIVEQLKMAAPLCDSLKNLEIPFAVFSKIEGNPTTKNLADAIACIRDGKHDCVIAMGGGSSLDIGKLAAFMHRQKLPVWDFEDTGDLWKKAETDNILPIIAIPTTSGTGSEVGRASVISDREKRKKKIIFHPNMLPSAVILDFTLTQGLPPKITAATGMDAFAHCFEALCANTYHPMADGIALEAMAMIKKYLPIAYSEPTNLEARAGMMAAASMAAVAFQKGLGAIHSISHSLGALYNIHHGLANAILLYPVLQFNKEAILPKVECMARVLECKKAFPNVSLFDGFANWLQKWQSQMEIPRSLTEVGVEKIDREKIVRLSLTDPSTPTNPKPLTSSGILEILDQIS